MIWLYDLYYELLKKKKKNVKTHTMWDVQQ